LPLQGTLPYRALAVILAASADARHVPKNMGCGSTREPIVASLAAILAASGEARHVLKYS